MEITPAEFEKLRTLIHRVTGIALSEQKRPLVKSRLARRLRANGLDSYTDYLRLLEAQGEAGVELGELVNAITTNKTDFFRESHHFDFVRDRMLPEVKRRAHQEGRRLRIWHAGCSTGEEPYTLAITLREALDDYDRWDVRQLASDIDSQVVAHAQRGVYEDDKVEAVPLHLRRRYFLKGRGEQQGKYRVRPELAKDIAFRQFNLLEPWPIRGDVQFDAIFCRNVVIYFDRPTQRDLFARFVQVLRPGGYLFIGHSETLFGVSDDFVSVGKTIYQLPGAVAEVAA